jgi:glycosyltransferase involved in cell wall biosynthesis
MKISIITVNYNNPEGLERTIKSVLRQTSSDYEYIIIDGASTKGDLDVIKKYDNGSIKWVSEKDSGIYNAMNKGVRKASGDYCLFMNSGDELFSADTIDQIIKCNLQADFVQGTIARPGNPIVYSKAPNENQLTLGWYYAGYNNFHQASIIKRDMLLQHPYDEKYRVSADLKFNVECIIKNGCSYQNIDVVVALYEYGGISTTKEHAVEVENLYIELFGNRIMRDIIEFDYLRHFPMRLAASSLRKLGTARFWQKLKKIK